MTAITKTNKHLINNHLLPLKRWKRKPFSVMLYRQHWISDKIQIFQVKSMIQTFSALMTVSMCVLTASWENSELARVHMLSRARYRRFVSLCCRNWPSWLQARTKRFGSLQKKKEFWKKRVLCNYCAFSYSPSHYYTGGKRLVHWLPHNSRYEFYIGLKKPKIMLNIGNIFSCGLSLSL